MRMSICIGVFVYACVRAYVRACVCYYILCMCDIIVYFIREETADRVTNAAIELPATGENKGTGENKQIRTIRHHPPLSRTNVWKTPTQVRISPITDITS